MTEPTGDDDVVVWETPPAPPQLGDPAKLSELQRLWLIEAANYNVASTASAS